MKRAKNMGKKDRPKTPIPMKVIDSASDFANTSQTTKLTVNSRLEEKDALKELNDCLASYIEKSQTLELQNHTYKKQIEEIVETKQTEITKIKSLYDTKIEDMLKMIHNINSEKLKIEMDFANCFEDRNNKIKELEEAKKNLANLKADNDALNKKIKEDGIKFNELELKVKNLNENLNFRNQYIEEIMEMNKKYNLIETTEHDGFNDISNERNDTLQNTLRDFRDQYENKMSSNRDKIENLYRKKLENYESSLQKNSMELKALNEKVTTLETSNGILTHRIKELEKMLSDERNLNKIEKQSWENELTRLRRENAEQLKDYQDLIDTKVALDIEIQTYRKLLEAEEARLNLSVEGKSGDDSRPAKRKRVQERKEYTVRSSVTQEELFHQQGDPVDGMDKSNCACM